MPPWTCLLCLCNVGGSANSAPLSQWPGERKNIHAVFMKATKITNVNLVINHFPKHKI